MTARTAIRRLCSALVVLVALAARPAQAAGIIVNSLAEGSVVGACTLRDAIAAANTDAAVSGCAAGAGGDTITFEVSGTITLATPLLLVSGSTVTVDGSGQAVTISGNSATRVLEVPSAATLDLQDVTITNGRASQPVFGGGVAVFIGGTLSARRTTFANNFAKDGGAIYDSGTVTIVDSTFSGNSASFGGGISVATSATGTLTVANSTFSANSAGSGGGLLNTKTATVTNSTFSDNRSSIEAGGGILNVGTLSLANTIIANSTAGGDCSNSLGSSSGTIVPSDVNLIADGSCPATGALTGDPYLGSLADNGGPTMTHALTAASTLAIDSTACLPAYPTDQRGVTRPQGAACDIGAFEFANSPPSVTGDAYATNEDATLTLAAPGVLGNDTDPDSGDTMTAVLLSGPTHAASFTLYADGSFSYTPAANYNGPDSFNYKARDAAGAESAAVTVTLTVNAVDDVPGIAVAGGGQCIGDTAGRITLALNDLDTPVANLTLGSSNASIVSSVAFGGTGATRTVTITTNKTGSATLTLSVSDGHSTATTTVGVRTGGNANDTLTGTNGADVLFGQNGDDRLIGNGGADLLCSGRGDDTMTGGAGPDSFDGGQGSNTATDFTPAQGDTKTGVR